MQCGLFIQMSEYLVDDHRVFDASVRRLDDDLYPPATLWADFDIDIEHPLQPLLPRACYHAPEPRSLMPAALPVIGIALSLLGRACDPFLVWKA